MCASPQTDGWRSMTVPMMTWCEVQASSSRLSIRTMLAASVPLQSLGVVVGADGGLGAEAVAGETSPACP